MVKGQPHPLDSPGQPEWFVDLVYEHSGGRRHPALVLRRSTYLEVEGTPGSGKRFLLCDRYGLVSAIADCLMSEWIPPFKTWGAGDVDMCDLEYDPRAWLPEWLVTQTSRAIAKRVSAQAIRLLADANPTIMQIHRAVFSATFGYNINEVIMEEELYKDKYLVKDLESYRAAQIAAGFVKSLQELVEWRSLFRPPDAAPYKALNKTLNNLPAGVPARLLFALSSFILPRPVTNRCELIATISAHNTIHFNVFAHATSGEIGESMRKVGRYLHYDFNPRRWREIRGAVKYVCDFPEPHNGRLGGLTDKAIRWHRDGQARIIQNAVSQLGHDTPLARPPIPLPKVAGVRFLETVGDVCSEAEEMGHCIASYAKRAVQGECYLFHVEYGQDTASVEVSPNGSVRQSQGPQNQQNEATKLGSQVLSRWGKQLRRLPEAGQSAALRREPLEE
jgi:hypothetical protein